MGEIKIAFEPSKLKLVDPKTLVIDPKNRNKHPPEQIERFCKLLKEYGMRWPILVSERTGVIKAGEGRLLASLKLKMPQVLVSYQEFDTDQQEYGFGISDNAIASWADLDLDSINIDVSGMDGFDIELLGIEDFKVIEADKLEPGCDEDEVPEPPVEPKSRLGDLYQLGNHRLLCGDSTSIDAVERLMGGEKADMVFTDPPYLQEAKGGKFDGVNKHKNLAAHDINDFEPETMFTILSVLDAESVYLHCNKALISDYIQYFEIDNRNWDLLAICKRNPLPFKGGNFLSDIEWILFSRKSGAYFDDKLNYDWYRKAQWVSVKGSEYGHPTEKWVGLIEQYLSISSKHNALVIDLFGGSGSTLIACEKTHRKCFMMELDPHYCDVIVARWEKYTGKKAELDGSTSNSN